ncbi:MAG: hypothetical protein EXQ79_00670 [Acidimicrobiia bacterium]|nr:hypothetical protein [Acidimicrobiia bacterium]
MTTLADFAPLEHLVEHALASGDETALHVLGYGEITSVLAWPNADGPWACKRLPVFDRADRLADFRAQFGHYVATLQSEGVQIHESRIEIVPTDDGTVAYIVQPTLEPSALGPAVLRGSSETDGRALLSAIIDHIATVVSPVVGLDAQLANWGLVDDELVYFDISTPMLRDEHGHDLLDTELFMSSLPPFLRPVVRKFLLGSILDQFFEPRAAALDLAANLYKERLGEWVPTVFELANERLRLDRALTVDEAKRYYRRDMRVWGMLQTMRRVDRSWQQKIRRRPYRFLLPGRINRRL